MKNKLIYLPILLTLTFASTGCETKLDKAANSENQTLSLDAESDAETEKTVLTMTAAYDLTTFETAFEEAYPNIDLQIEKMATATINSEIERRLRNNHGSDIIITNLPEGSVADYTYDLSAESFVENYQSTIMSNVSIDGECRYLPLPGAYYGYIINKSLLDELNLDMPETREDLLNILAVAKENNIGVTEDNGYGFGFSDAGSTFIGAYFAAEFATDYLSTIDGAKWIADYGDKKASFSDVWASSVDFIKTCVENGYMDSDKIIVNYNGHLSSNSNAFKAEVAIPERTAILTYGNVNMYEKICNLTEDEIVMLPCLPSTENGNKLLSAVSNDYIGINNGIAEDDVKLNAAFELFEYLSTEEGQAKWIEDTDCFHSYLNGYSVDFTKLPESISSYAEGGFIFTNPFSTNILSYIGKNLAMAGKNSMEIDDALATIDDYYINGIDNAKYDLSVVGSVASDMLYENNNVRVKETELGNLISDAIREMTGADVALVNGGGIRSSIYQGDVTADDLTYVCPYGNLIVVVKMDGATLKEAITNGIQKTWKPAGQFLQVSGIKYSYIPAADESETAKLVSISYIDGSELKDDDIITVAYTNYMAGSSGYVDAGDGFIMLNVYDEDNPVNVEMVSETNKTYCDALKEYFANHNNEIIDVKLEGRIEVVE